VDLSEFHVIWFCISLPISDGKTKSDLSCDEIGGYIVLKWAKIKFVWHYRISSESGDTKILTISIHIMQSA
jgi:hypothetical protein